MQYPSRLLPLALSLLLLPAMPRAQEATDANQPKLKSSDIKSISKKLRDWYAILMKQYDYENALIGKSKTKSDRKKLRSFRKDARKKRDAFEKEFAKKSKKVNILRSVPDLVQIMEGCFPYKRMSNGGEAKRTSVLPRTRDNHEIYPYAVRWPKVYKPDTQSWPLIIALPPRVDGKWLKGKEYLAADWPESSEEVLTQYLVAVPDFPEESDLSKVYGRGEEVDEKGAKATARLLTIFGHMVANYRVDTNRIFLEASAESVPFALRIVSLFPHRFAGLILKNPQGIGNCTASNFSLVPTLIISDEGNKGTAKALAKMLPKAKVLEAKGELPFVENGDEIVEWMKGIRRNLFSSHIVYEPVMDAYRNAYWARIESAELVVEKQPRLEIKADRKLNKISITTANIGKIRLYLNDLIVDLDREITIEINGKVVQQLKKTRNRRLIWDQVEGLVLTTGDQGFIFTSMASFEVPEVEEEPDKTESSEGDK